MKKYRIRTTVLLLFLIVTSGLLFLIITKPNLIQKLSTSTTQFQMNIYLSQSVEQFIANHPYSETITNPNNSSLTIEVPEDSLIGTYSVTAFIYCTNKDSISTDYPPPIDKLAIGIFCDISFSNSSDGTPIEHLDEPVTITYTYVNEEVAELDPDSLAIYHWNGTQWIILDNNIVDTTQKTVSGTNQDFSPFMLFGVLGDPGEGVEDDDDTETPTTPSTPSPPTGQGVPLPVIGNEQRVILYRVGDLNSDYLVNLTDFSIAAYWYKRLLSIELLLIEGRNLNGDGIINISDFELMLKKLT